MPLGRRAGVEGGGSLLRLPHAMHSSMPGEKFKTLKGSQEGTSIDMSFTLQDTN